MTRVVGVDGCPGGWIAVDVALDTGAWRSARFARFDEILALRPRPAAVAVDIPIGLPERGARACDVEARRLVGPRRASVFPAPIRPILHARRWEEANARRRRIEGKGVARQTFGLFAKIREVDAALRRSPDRAVFEVHPELSFRALAGGRPMAHPKKTAEGFAERRGLLEAEFGDLSEALAAFRRSEVARDDLLDALAGAWSARRIARGEAVRIPLDPPRDARGLPMAIAY